MASSPPPPAKRSRRRARQYIRKVTGVAKPNIKVAGALDALALEVADVTERALALVPDRRQPPPTLPPLRRPEVRKRMGLAPFPG